jgi:hypothetical protein
MNKKTYKGLFYAGGVFGWVVLLLIGGCGVLPHLLYRGLDRELNRVTSPDGKYDAVVQSHYAPPYASGRATICIVPAGSPYDRKQTILATYALYWTKVKWTKKREITIVHPACEPILHYEPIWPKYPRLGKTPETIRIILNIDHKKDSLNKVVEK